MSRRRWSYLVTSRLLFALTFVHAVLVFAQAVLAGQFLGGNATALTAHEINGTGIITLVSLILILDSILLWRPGRGPAWPIWASLLVFAAEIAQIVFGFEGRLAIHIPLGVVLFGLSLALVGGALRILRTAAPAGNRAPVSGRR